MMLVIFKRFVGPKLLKNCSGHQVSFQFWNWETNPQQANQIKYLSKISKLAASNF
jgi:hypothetical protein